MIGPSMPVARGFRFLPLAAVAMAGSGAAAATEAAREPVRIVYEAEADCPDQALFERAFRVQAGDTTLARLDELARTLTVTVHRSDSEFRARVELVDRDGASVSRELGAPSCAEAVDAIALVAALAARAQAERLDRERDESGSARPAAAPHAGSEPKLAPPSVAPTSKVAAPQNAGARSRAAKLTAALAAGAGVTTGVGPGLAPGLVLEGRLSWGETPTHSVALLAALYDTFTTELENGDGRLRLIKTRAELCPFEPRLTRSLRLSPCAGFELGSQTGEVAESESIANARPQARLWAAAALTVRARYYWQNFGAALGPELVVPLTRNSFVLTRPDLPLYDVPGVAVGLNALFGVVF
jgi:hypothetical protein